MTRDSPGHRGDLLEFGGPYWYHGDRLSGSQGPKSLPRGYGGPSAFRLNHLSFEEQKMAMYVGEALVGEGNEVAHIDLIIGDKAGPAGMAFANALSTQSQGHSNLLAVLAPNLLVKPVTVMITKVTIKGAKQAVQMFGPAQYAVAKAVADSVDEGIIPKDQCEKLCIVCGVFIHWEAADDKKIYQYNYEATKLSIARAMKGEPSAQEVSSKKASAKHPFSGV